MKQNINQEIYLRNLMFTQDGDDEEESAEDEEEKDTLQTWCKLKCFLCELESLQMKIRAKIQRD